MAKGIEAIVFDLDGTLIDSVPDVCAAINRALAAAGHGAVTLDAARGMVGWGARVMLEKAVAAVAPGTAALPDDAMARLLESYLSFYREEPAARTVIYPGVIDVLEELSAAGLLMGICTNKPHGMTTVVLDALDMTRFFKGIAGADAVPFRKPDARHVQHTIGLMGATGRSAVMVGDSETDMAAGRNAGLPVIAVTYGYAHGAVDDLDADIRIDRFDALPAALERLCRS